MGVVVVARMHELKMRRRVPVDAKKMVKRLRRRRRWRKGMRGGVVAVVVGTAVVVVVRNRMNPILQTVHRPEKATRIEGPTQLPQHKQVLLLLLLRGRMRRRVLFLDGWRWKVF
jgi:hypothetical protein